MRTFTLVCIFLGIALNLAAQNKTSQYFKLPTKATAQDYISGTLLVKIKPNKKDQLQSATGRVRGLEQILSMKTLLPEGILQASARTRGPRTSTSGIDISNYMRVHVSGTANIENVINELYATGYFEIVEPEYIDKLYYTPNDPSIGSQYYLGLIKAYEAWDITKGSNDVVIAIIDTGGDLDHPDLVNKLFTNTLDPVGGGDNDANGFADDYRGWDFMGADTLNINDPNFIGDNNPQVNKGGAISHGTNVAGCAAAQADNSVGIAGVGFNTKILFTKHSADNQRESALSVYRGYSGILYAAEVLYANGKRAIINTSWGGTFRSQIAQDIITYVTLDRNALVVAAAGNDDTSENHYPSGYDYALSVAATSSTDAKASFSNYGKTVDISAPGVSIRTTAFDDSYSNPNGTSFASPIVAGAAALIWAHKPTYTAVQVGEQLRVTADESFYSVNSNFKNLLGKGRLDIQRALNLELPSIRASKPKLVNNNGLELEPGQSGKLILNFTNYLKSSSPGLQVSITSLSSVVTVSKGTITLGVVQGNSTVSNSLIPFELSISQFTPLNTTADILITYKDGSYTDYQYFSFLINPSFIDIDDNLVTTTITATGRLGFDDPDNQLNGIGFVFNDSPILYEMGLIMGTSSSIIKNNVRGINSGFDQDFFIKDKIKKIRPGERSYSEVFGSFLDASSEAGSNLKIDYRTLVWKEDLYNKFIIVEYSIKNTSNTALSNFHFGIFADWDISVNGGQDKASYYNQDGVKIGYVYPAQSTELPMAGIQLLNNKDQNIYYAIDNNHQLSGIPFGLYDGYTDAEKFISISTNRLQSVANAGGNDVSHVMAAGPFNIPSQGSVKVTFALHAGFNLDDLIRSAKYADTVYNFTLNAPKPIVGEANVCYDGSLDVTASNASSFKWYDSFTGGEVISTNSTINLTNIKNDTTLYVSNADNSFESVRTPVIVKVKANPAITTSGFTTICDGQSLILSVGQADSYAWSNGESNQSIEVTQAGDYSVTVTDTNLGCSSESEIISVLVNPNAISNFTSSSESLTSGIPIQFTNQSTDAVNLSWNFGDGGTSTQTNPTHLYAIGGNYTVTLTATAANGCQDVFTKEFSIVTSNETGLNTLLTVHPNPTTEKIIIESDGIPSPYLEFQLKNSQGQNLYSTIKVFSGNISHEISMKDLQPGMYILKISDGTRSVVKKIIKTN